MDPEIFGTALAVIAVGLVVTTVALIVSFIITFWQLSTATSVSSAMAAARIAEMAPLLLSMISVSALICSGIELLRPFMTRPSGSERRLVLCDCSDDCRTR